MRESGWARLARHPNSETPSNPSGKLRSASCPSNAPAQAGKGDHGRLGDHRRLDLSRTKRELSTASSHLKCSDAGVLRQSHVGQLWGRAESERGKIRPKGTSYLIENRSLPCFPTIQVLVGATPWRFKSSHPHQQLGFGIFPVFAVPACG